jgi:hypothetical protein
MGKARIKKYAFALAGRIFYLSTTQGVALG